MNVVAMQGDTLDALCHRHLGRTDAVVEQALELNPGLAAMGSVLPMGTVVKLPDAAPAKVHTKLVQLWD